MKVECQHCERMYDSDDSTAEEPHLYCSQVCETAHRANDYGEEIDDD